MLVIALIIQTVIAIAILAFVVKEAHTILTEEH